MASDVCPICGSSAHEKYGKYTEYRCGCTCFTDGTRLDVPACNDISRLRTWLLWSLQDKRDWRSYMLGRGCTAEQVDEVARLLGEVKDGE